MAGTKKLTSSEVDKIKDNDTSILVSKYLHEFFELISSDNKIYRNFSKEEREETLKKSYNNLIEKLKDYNEKYIYVDHDFTSLITLYVDKLNEKKKNDELQTLRWNISDIITYSEQYFDKNLNENINNLFQAVIMHFRSLMIYIDIIKQDDINKKFKEIETKLAEIDPFKNEQIYKNLQENVKLSSEKVIQIGASVRDILPQAVTIIGIFVAIVLIFVADISLLDSFKILNEKEFNIFLSAIILVTHLSLNLLFALLFLVSRIAKSSINVRCSKFRDISPYYRNQVHHYNIDEQKSMESEDLLANQLMDLNQELRAITNDRRICANCAYADVERSNQRGDFGLQEEYISENKTKATENSDKSTRDDNNLTKKFIQKPIKEQCGHMDRFIRKYPYMFFSNVIFFLAEFSILVLWFIRNVFYKGYSLKIINPFISTISLTCFVIIALTSVSVVFYSLGKKTALRKNIAVFIGISILLMLMLVMITFNYGFSFQK